MIHIWIFNFTVPFLIASIFAFLPLWIVSTRRNPPQPFSRTMLLSAFIGYLVAVLCVTLDPDVLIKIGFAFSPELNLHPLYQISGFMTANISPHVVFVNLLGNILLFVPIGFSLPLLWKRRRPVWFGTALTALFSLMIELIQLFTPRVTDIDDIILNTAGGLLGALLYWICFPKRRRKEKQEFS